VTVGLDSAARGAPVRSLWPVRCPHLGARNWLAAYRALSVTPRPSTEQLTKPVRVTVVVPVTVIFNLRQVPTETVGTLTFELPSDTGDDTPLEIGARLTM